MLIIQFYSASILQQSTSHLGLIETRLLLPWISLPLVRRHKSITSIFRLIEMGEIRGICLHRPPSTTARVSFCFFREKSIYTYLWKYFGRKCKFYHSDAHVVFVLQWSNYAHQQFPILNCDCESWCVNSDENSKSFSSINWMSAHVSDD